MLIKNAILNLLLSRFFRLFICNHIFDECTILFNLDLPIPDTLDIAGLLLTVGALTTIYPGHALGTHCTAGPVCGGNGGNAGTGINGGTCTTNNCVANGGSGNGGNGQKANGGQGQNGAIGADAIPCVNGHRTLTSSDERTVTQAC